jgi:hypothetical protein
MEGRRATYSRTSIYSRRSSRVYPALFRSTQRDDRSRGADADDATGECTAADATDSAAPHAAPTPAPRPHPSHAATVTDLLAARRRSSSTLINPAPTTSPSPPHFPTSTTPPPSPHPSFSSPSLLDSIFLSPLISSSLSLPAPPFFSSPLLVSVSRPLYRVVAGEGSGNWDPLQTSITTRRLGGARTGASGT